MLATSIPKSRAFNQSQLVKSKQFCTRRLSLSFPASTKHTKYCPPRMIRAFSEMLVISLAVQVFYLNRESLPRPVSRPAPECDSHAIRAQCLGLLRCPRWTPVVRRCQGSTWAHNCWHDRAVHSAPQRSESDAYQVEISFRNKKRPLENKGLQAS